MSLFRHIKLPAIMLPKILIIDMVDPLLFFHTNDVCKEYLFLPMKFD